MRDHGFLLFDSWGLRRIGPVLAQVDLLFIRCGSILGASTGKFLWWAENYAFECRAIICTASDVGAYHDRVPTGR
jgi:hypothetical protein